MRQMTIWAPESNSRNFGLKYLFSVTTNFVAIQVRNIIMCNLPNSEAQVHFIFTIHNMNQG